MNYDVKYSPRRDFIGFEEIKPIHEENDQKEVQK
jgi:hypothetical protein